MDSVAYPIGREDFVRLYGRYFDCVTERGILGNIVLRSDGWKQRRFEFGLWGFVWDQENFDEVVKFISARIAPGLLVLAEIETVDCFSEALVVECAIEPLQKAVGKSMLSHFRTICLDDTCSWSLLFDNDLNQTLAVRSI